MDKLTSRDSALAEELQELQLSNFDKVNLWLVYRQRKPSTDVSVDETVYDPNARTLTPEQQDKRQLESWLKQAKLMYITLERTDPGVHIDNSQEIDVILNRTIYCVSHSLSQSAQLVQLLQNFKLDDSQIHEQLGVSYGFPAEAARLYSTAIADPVEKMPKQMVHFWHYAKQNPEYYWDPYVRYLVRKNFEIQDSMVGKKWADYIRSEIPSLAHDFEQDLLLAYNKQKFPVT